MYSAAWLNTSIVFTLLWEVWGSLAGKWQEAQRWSEAETHRRCGHAGPADGLRAGVQRSIFGFVEHGVHTERLLAVHRHHDCRREGGSLSVVFVRFRLGCFLKRKTSERKKPARRARPEWKSSVISVAGGVRFKKRKRGEVTPALLLMSCLPFACEWLL